MEMTVGKLIELLRKYYKDQPIYAIKTGERTFEIEGVIELPAEDQEYNDIYIDLE